MRTATVTRPLQRAGIYTRISLDPDGTETATQRQRVDCEKYAAGRGWAVADVYRDHDTSAWQRGVRRPAFDRLIDDLRNGVIDIALGYRVDRMTRNWRDWIRLEEAAKAGGGAVVSVADNIDTTSATGAFQAELMVMLAKQESKNISTRLARKHREAAENGIPAAGPRPYGFAPGRRTIIPAEAAVIREMRDRLLGGESLTTIVRDINTRGIPAAKGGPWALKAATSALLAPGTAGCRLVDGQPVPGKGWAGILTLADQEHIRAVLASRRTWKRRTGSRSYLGSAGLYRCGLCGASLRGSWTATKKRKDGAVRRPGEPQYVCRKTPQGVGCGKVSATAAPLDAFVIAAFTEAAANPEVLKPMEREGTAAEIVTEMQRLDAARTQLADDHYVGGLIARPAFLAATRKLDDQYQAATERLARLRSTPALVAIAGQTREEIARRLEAATLDQRRALVAALIDHVKLVPASVRGRGFGPERVEIVWRN